MKQINYATYFDKILGCYLGVSVGGMLGAPYEGVKEIIDIDIDFSAIDHMAFNDDLDLQVLFFQAIERYGMHFNSNQLAKLFIEQCFYAPGEFAYFKKNYRRGILPPVSGWYNDEFYSEGMGCAIRGELWGCLFPGDPNLVEKYAFYDGSIDHGIESIYAEYYVANMISSSFFTNDINEIIEIAKNRIPKKSKFRTMLDQVVDWCDEFDEIDEIRRRIIWEFGHPDCTNVFQNFGFITAGLKLYFDDFEMLIKKTVRCGFDTDCTSGIVAAVWGAVNGGNAFRIKYGLDDVRLVIGVDCSNYNGKIIDFSKAVALHGADLHKKGCGEVRILNIPDDVNYSYVEPVLYEVKEYRPELRFNVKNSSVIYAYVPNGEKGQFIYEKNPFLDSDMNIIEEASGQFRLEITSCLRTNDRVPASLCGKIYFKNTKGEIDPGNSLFFGYAPPCVMEVSQPFIDTYAHLKFEKNKSYYLYFDKESNENIKYDNIRKYHLNYDVSMNTGKLSAKKLSLGQKFECKRVTVYEDKFDTSFLTGYVGPCVLYVRRTIELKEFGNYSIWCGCENDVEIWLNGDKIAENRGRIFFTYETLHVNSVRFKAGKNYLVFKLLRTTGNEKFSCDILEESKTMDFPEHVLNYFQISDSKK